LIDDLAVSYIKLDQNEKAIQILLKQLQNDSLRYETLANLGTAYIHHFKFKKGLTFINKAIEINPEAHFGREKYQKYVVEYLIEKKYKKGSPICNHPKDAHERSQHNFYAFLLKKEKIKPFDKKEEFHRKNAIIGITGMMKFGNFDSPILLECLGDILIGTGYGDKETDLSSLVFQHLDNTIHNNQWKQLLQSNSMVKKDYVRNFKAYSTFLNQKLDSALALGNQKFSEIQRNEKTWLASGLNPELEFGYKYYGKEKKQKKLKQSPKTEKATTQKHSITDESSNNSFYTTLIISILGGLVLLIFILLLTKKR
jgi:hypothetical protein